MKNVSWKENVMVRAAVINEEKLNEFFNNPGGLSDLFRSGNIYNIKSRFGVLKLNTKNGLKYLLNKDFRESIKRERKEKNRSEANYEAFNDFFDSIPEENRDKAFAEHKDKEFRYYYYQREGYNKPAAKKDESPDIRFRYYEDTFEVDKRLDKDAKRDKYPAIRALYYYLSSFDPKTGKQSISRFDKSAKNDPSHEVKAIYKEYIKGNK